MTSFSCFKYMSLYSAIQFTSVSFLYAKASNLGDFQFLFIDVLLILPIAIFMGWAGPAPKLCQKRPTADLVSRKVLTPLIGLMMLCIAFQAIAYVTVKEQPWYIPPKIKHEKSNIKNSENTALFLTSCFEYVFSGVVLNAGPPFRQRISQNCKQQRTLKYTQITDKAPRAIHHNCVSHISSFCIYGTQAFSLATETDAAHWHEFGLRVFLDCRRYRLSDHCMGIRKARSFALG